MAADKRETGAASARVAANVRRLRMQRGLSTYELSKQLKSIGWPISPSSITRIEQNERRVDADDLCALAILLGVPPNSLVFGEDIADGAETEVITAPTAVTPAAMWAWACGEHPLVLPGQAPPSPGAVAMFALESAPHRAGDVIKALSRRSA